MDIFDKLYQKVGGYYFGFLAVGFSLLCILISYLLFIQTDPSFTILTHFISDLGDGPNFSNVVFSVGVIGASLISLLFYIYLTRFLLQYDVSKVLPVVALVSAIISSIGGFLVGIFPSDTAPLAHRIGALLSFGGSFFISIFYAAAEVLNAEFDRRVAISGFLIAPFPIAFLSLYLLLHIPNINSTIPIFTEWLAYFTRMGWTALQGAYLFKFSK